MGALSRCVDLATVALAGGLPAQQDASGTRLTAQAVMTATLRAAPAGLAFVDTLLSANVPGGFGMATTNASGFLIADWAVAENRN